MRKSACSSDVVEIQESVAFVVTPIQALQGLLAERFLRLRVSDQDPDYILLEKGMSEVLTIAQSSRFLSPEGQPLTVLMEDLLRFRTDPDLMLFDRELFERVRRRAMKDLGDQQ